MGRRFGVQCSGLAATRKRSARTLNHYSTPSRPTTEGRLAFADRGEDATTWGIRSPKTLSIADERPSWFARPRVAVALLLLINFVNYVDRQVLAAVEVKIGEEF